MWLGFALGIVIFFASTVVRAQSDFQLSSASISAGTGPAKNTQFNLTLGILGRLDLSAQMQSPEFSLNSGPVQSVYGADADRDGYTSGNDNCVDIANPDQANADMDLFGDLCDNDDDNDDVDDAQDNCPLIANTNQQNSDNDDQGGDACDPDRDNDGVENDFDLNPDNESICQDLDGDTCDDCSNGADNFALAVNFDTENDGLDTNTNGICNLTDPDDDGDGVDDSMDNCQLISNPLQEDSDGNGTGDVCELDDSLCFPIVTKQGSLVLICL